MVNYTKLRIESDLTLAQEEEKEEPTTLRNFWNHRKSNSGTLSGKHALYPLSIADPDMTQAEWSMLN